MARLTPISVRNAKPGRHADGNGLYLIVRDTGSRQWLLRVVVPDLNGGKGKRQDFGLGSAADVSLADARKKAAQWREWAKAGRDPRVAQRVADKERADQDAVYDRTFKWVAERAHEAMRPSWRNAKHSDQWISTLATYAFPKIGSEPVETIDGPAIVNLLSPIWLSKPETARRVRQRVAAVLDYAHGQGWRSTAAPMRSIMAGKALAKQPKGKEHHEAVAYADAPATIATLRAKPETVGRLALEFAIVTATRSGEVRGATWGEVDLENALWTIPAERMKAKREHVVPLAPRAMELLAAAAAYRKSSKPDAAIFPGAAQKAISDMTMLKAVRDVAPGTTVHGWRSTFRDWIAECTNFDGEVAEMALAHTISNKVEKAYRRGNLLEKRRAMMAAWDAYLSGESMGNVVILDSRRVPA